MKKQKINTYIQKKFIIFSLIVVLLLLISRFLVETVGEIVLSNYMSNFFAEKVIDENYENTDFSMLKDIDGWVTIIDENNNVVFSTNKEERKTYECKDLIELHDGIEIINGEKYFATSKFFEKDNKEYLGLICIPKKYIMSTVSLYNTGYSLRYVFSIFIGGVLFFVVGYILTVYGMAHAIKKTISKPLQYLSKAFSNVAAGDYDTRAEYNGIYEFETLKESFNVMVLKLQEMTNNQKKYHQQRQQLFADLGHDLKTPITIIRGNSMALLEKELPKEQQEKLLKSINGNAVDINDLIDFLVYYTKLDCADYVLNLSECDLAEYLRQIVIDKIDFFDNNNIKLEIDITEKYMPINIDEKMFKRAIENLLNNIVQHNPKGIEALICLNDNNRIVIADTGERIPENIISDIFEPFVSGNTSRNSSNHNCGLGLSISKKIIEKHGGKLDLVQEYGHYTKAFIIDLQ
ncbi:MAG: HAMP domain-containing histidine kinase [Pseudobutyrivibrio sp.]|nr:HAMP domain-containing histidine kinase [Pseudobutyrivibrio sp.]